jgi:TPR repeat protein
VENDIPEAVVFLGDLYRVGELGVTTNMKKAVKIYKRAVELGNVRAMTNLGGCYERGHGVAQDNKKAMQLYRMASARGDARAQCNLGLLLSDEGNSEAARYHFQLAAERGYTTGEYLLGVELFKLVTDFTETQSQTDLAKAAGYFVRAAAKGHEQAQFSLDRIEDIARSLDKK